MALAEMQYPGWLGRLLTTPYEAYRTTPKRCGS
jgi:hypothetical protein